MKSDPVSVPSDWLSTAGQIDEAIAAARDAVHIYDDAADWLIRVATTFAEPLAVEVWVFDETLQHVVLVQHRWRGWVPPGGAVEPAEPLRVAAARELHEETGLRVQLFARPAAACVRSYRTDWVPTLGISYAAVATTAQELQPEPGQPARWAPLDRPWQSTLAVDRDRMLAFIDALGT